MILTGKESMVCVYEIVHELNGVEDMAIFQKDEVVQQVMKKVCN